MFIKIKKSNLSLLSIGFFIAVLASGCATSFEEAHRHSDGRRGAYGYRIEPIQNMAPFTNYAAFTGNAKTSEEQARAYTEMAALKHCRSQGRFLIIDSKVRNVADEIKITKTNVYQNGDMSEPQKLKPTHFKAFMVLFGCSDKNSSTKISERGRILKAFCKAKDSKEGEYCSPDSNY